MYACFSCDFVSAFSICSFSNSFEVFKFLIVSFFSSMPDCSDFISDFFSCSSFMLVCFTSSELSFAIFRSFNSACFCVSSDFMVSRLFSNFDFFSKIVFLFSEISSTVFMNLFSSNFFSLSVNSRYFSAFIFCSSRGFTLISISL